MILIPDQSLFVLGEGGQRQSYDFNALCNDLRQAFQENAIQDRWLIDQFTLTVEERLRSQSPMTESAIDALLASVLTASGYSDVAKSFTRIRGMDVLSQYKGTLKHWTAQRLKDILRAQLPLSPRQVDTLSERCSKTLNDLHFSKVSDTFVRELCIHLLQEPEQETKPRSEERDSWQQGLSSELQDLLSRHILTVYPIAPLFPRPQVALDLLAYVNIAGGWDSELALDVKLPALGKQTLSLLEKIRSAILRKKPDFTDCPGHIIIPQYQRFLEHCLPEGQLRERRGLDKRLRLLLKTILTQRTPFEVMLSFR